MDKCYKLLGIPLFVMLAAAKFASPLTGNNAGDQDIEEAAPDVMVYAT